MRARDRVIRHPWSVAAVSRRFIASRRVSSERAECTIGCRRNAQKRGGEEHRKRTHATTTRGVGLISQPASDRGVKNPEHYERHGAARIDDHKRQAQAHPAAVMAG